MLLNGWTRVGDVASIIKKLIVIVVNFLSLNGFSTSEGFREEGFKNLEILEGWGHHKLEYLKMRRTCAVTKVVAVLNCSPPGTL